MALSDGMIHCWSPWLGASAYVLLNRSSGNHSVLTNMDAGTDWLGTSLNGRFGYVLDLDATNDFFELSRSIDFPASYSCTISLWFRPTQWVGANPGIIRSGTSAANQAIGGDFFIFQGSTGLPFIRRNGSDILRPSSGTGFTLDNWQHCVMASSPSSVQCYRNGVLIHSATHSIAGTAFSFWRWGFQGAISTPEKLCGQVAEFAMWNRIVSAPEVLELFRLGPGWYQPYQRKRYAFVGAAFNRRRRILCGDYS